MDDNKIEYWFTTESGAHIPVRRGQTKEDALKEFLAKRKKRSKTYDSKDDFGNIVHGVKKAQGTPQLSKQEYAALRAEVMRKNAAQKGKVKPINHAFTANWFYVYSTTGDDSFTVLRQYDIERDREAIEMFLKEFKN